MTAAPRSDIYERVTSRIVEQLEQGVRPWTKPWSAGQAARRIAIPLRANGKPYRGVRQQFVKLGPSRGDQVAVVSGVRPGEEVVTSGVFKLRSGAAILVSNEIQPANDPTPDPEDN